MDELLTGMIFVGVGSNSVTQSKDENRYEKPSLHHCCEMCEMKPSDADSRTHPFTESLM